MDEFFCVSSYVFMKYIYDCCTVEGYALIFAYFFMVCSRLNCRELWWLMADFKVKYKKLRTGNRRKVAMSCSDSLQVGFHSGLLSRGDSLWLLIRGGSTRKGCLSQASGIRKGRDLVEVVKRVGKSVIWVCERAHKGYQGILWLYKVKKTFYFWDWLLFKKHCIYSS